MPGSTPLIIEAALNGGTPKIRNPFVPRTPAEVTEDALACLDAGAAIVHNHTDDAVIGSPDGVHAAEPYIEAWRPILAARPDAILYPTMAGGGPHTTVETRYAHIPALAEAGLLRVGVVDPGSLNFGGLDADGRPSAVDVIYMNSYRDARYMMDTCEQYALGPTIAIFEPGFLRVALAYHAAGRMPAGAIIKFYFSSGAPGFGLPPTIASLEAYLGMLEGSGLPWSVAALGGDIVASGLAEVAIARGGHVRVGLEDYNNGDRTPGNVELVREVVALAKQAGREIATCTQAAEILGLRKG